MWGKRELIVALFWTKQERRNHNIHCIPLRLFPRFQQNSTEQYSLEILGLVSDQMREPWLLKKRKETSAINHAYRALQKLMETYFSLSTKFASLRSVSKPAGYRRFSCANEEENTKNMQSVEIFSEQCASLILLLRKIIFREPRQVLSSSFSLANCLRPPRKSLTAKQKLESSNSADDTKEPSIPSYWFYWFRSSEQSFLAREKKQAASATNPRMPSNLVIPCPLQDCVSWSLSTQFHHIITISDIAWKSR